MKKINLNNIYAWPLVTRILIIGLVCALVFYLGYMWDISDLYSQVLSIQQQEEDVKNQLEITISKQNKVKNEITNYNELQSSLLEWRKKLILYPELPALLNEILKIGGNNHLTFNLFSPETEVKTGPYFKVPIKIKAVGTYHQIAEFVSQIANLPWIVVISDFEILREDKKDNPDAKVKTVVETNNSLIANLTLEVYYIGDKIQKK